MNGYQDLTTNIENSRNCLRRIARNDDHEFSRESIVNLMEKFVKTVNSMDETILVPCRLMDRSVGDSTDNVQPAIEKTSHHHHHNHGKRKGTSVHDNLKQSDLFNLYTMLNEVKIDLLWGRNGEEQSEEITKITKPNQQEQQITQLEQLTISNSKTQQQQQQPPATATTNIATNTTTATATTNNNNNSNGSKGHVRRPSTASVASSNSTNTLSDTESELSNENDSGIESEHNRDVDKSSDLARQYRTHLLGLYRCLEQMTEAANYLTNRYQSDVGPV